MRIAPFAIFLVMSLLFAVMLLDKGKPTSPGTASQKPLPALSIATLDGKKQWDHEALKGRVTVLNFFATWCTPCAAEMPELAALKQQFPDIHLEGVAWNDEPKALQSWLKKHRNPFAHVWLDEKGDATIALGIRGIPETFIVDRQGMVRYRLAGPLTPDLREGEIGALLNTLLSETSNAR